MRKLFASESVTEGHPDKLCDQIADAILDAIIRKKPKARVAWEVFATGCLYYWRSIRWWNEWNCPLSWAGRESTGFRGI